MRCPWCGSDDDRVVESRNAEDGTAIRRRRECSECKRRYTTFERVEGVPLLVVKRGGYAEPFDRVKVEAGLRAACKNRPVDDSTLQEIVAEVEETLRGQGDRVPSEEVGRAVLERLRAVDEVAYVRFASVYKDFDDARDFQREIRALIKSTEPKRAPARRAVAHPSVDKPVG